MTRILLVDDSLFIRKMVRRMLEPQGFQIVGEAGNGEEGIGLYESLRPDVVIMDVTMPVKGGLEASKEILYKFPCARIILLTAMGRADIVEEGKNIGVKYHLQKPFKPGELSEAIKKCIMNSR